MAETDPRIQAVHDRARDLYWQGKITRQEAAEAVEIAEDVIASGWTPPTDPQLTAESLAHIRADDLEQELTGKWLRGEITAEQAENAVQRYAALKAEARADA